MLIASCLGDIMHLQVMNDHILVLSSVKVVNDLLEKRSRTYSGRPFADIAEMLSGGLALKTMYGINVTAGDDPMISVAKIATHTADKIFEPFFIAILQYCPFIMSVPRWIPVLGPIRRYVEITRKHLEEFRELPIQHIQRNTESGFENDGVVPRFLKRLDTEDASSMDEIHRIKDVASTIYAAAADTTLSSIGTFFLAMVRNAQSQRTAQQEIDTVVGRNRLPDLGDREKLPFIEAVYREVMRWHPAVPIGEVSRLSDYRGPFSLALDSAGVPHLTTDHDEYCGYFIPQDTIIFANIWAMTHDEKVYPEPYDFRPERFLNMKVNINDVLAYGFGRRICVGRHLADAMLWLTFASVLACFNIDKERDEQGKDIDVPERYSDGPGLFSYPLPFRCNITPRHLGVESLILECHATV
uniref:Cytochrome P450 n=1 Tax=Moniliophthora roreri TaxID=221103 RepID=A0A0W0F7R4_MONRR